MHGSTLTGSFSLEQVSSHSKVVRSGLEKKEQLVFLKFPLLSSYF